MLFSEPKIPQSDAHCGTPITDRGFSALQRAENSSIDGDERGRVTLPPFQCSSASRKFLNRRVSRRRRRGVPRFQCSSASRKFLNEIDNLTRLARFGSFSALQRAENSSILTASPKRETNSAFQCSSASRKFLNRSVPADTPIKHEVSVLFSEPKIPQ